MSIFSIIFAILLFSLLILVHELGHFLTAKLFKIQVNEFSMFMGPAIFKKQKGETLYSIRCIPIGGFCAMEGEDGESDNPRAFHNAKWWKRLIVLVAGSFMNLIAGFILLLIFNSSLSATPSMRIDYAEPNSAFIQEDGIQVGDTILEIDGYNIYTNTDFSLLTMRGDEYHDVTVLRDGKKITFSNYKMEKTIFNDETEPRYGITFGSDEKTVGGVLSYTVDSSASVVQSVWLSLKMLIFGEVSLNEIGGPVMIVQTMSETAQRSPGIAEAILSMIYFGGFIAINLAVMNMLPIPALDGGRSFALLITAFVEKITRKKINPKYEGYIHGIGMILLLIFMALVMFKDIFRIFEG